MNAAVDIAPAFAQPGDPEGTPDLRRSKLFLATRLLVATLLLGGTLVLIVEGKQDLQSFTPRFLVALIAAVYGLSLATAIWLAGASNRRPVAITQISSDLLLTTGLVYVTGGATSGFTFLFGVTVLMAAMVSGERAARLTGAAAFVLYATLTSCLWFDLLPAPPDQSPKAYHLPATDLIYGVSLHLAGLGLVMVLATALAGRLHAAGGKLRLAEANAVTLARLNDDIVRSMSSGLLTTDCEGRIRTINSPGADMFRVEPARILGHSAGALLPGVVQLITRALRHVEHAVVRTECRAQRTDGSRFPVGFSLTRLINVDGSATGTLIVFQDLTEIEQLRLTAQRQERLAVLGRLSAGLAHEIRNPLSSISGSVQLVRDSPQLNPQDRELLGIVLDEVERLDDLVSTMLLVGKPRPPQLETFDLRSTVKDVVHVASRGPAAAAGIRVVMDIADEPIEVNADPRQVRQVLWNLVKNALQASPPDATVQLRAWHNEQGLPELQVSDQGDGLDAAQQARVYDMFHSERTHGAGIGLALVRQIVDGHGGHIAIDSAAGQGATFIVTLRRPADEAGVCPATLAR